MSFKDFSSTLYKIYIQKKIHFIRHLFFIVYFIILINIPDYFCQKLLTKNQKKIHYKIIKKNQIEI